MRLVEFEVGQQYENRKGIYEVLEIQGDAMRIRWKSGEEVDTTVDMQSRIIDGMQRELEHITDTRVSSHLRERPARKKHRIRQR